MAFTFFFRDMATINAIECAVLPELKESRAINVWDAGCANGAEAYTLAITFRENMGPFAFRKLHIHATDLNPQFCQVVTDGVYSAEELGRVPESIRSAYFHPVEGSDLCRADDTLRRSIRFEHHDLTSLQPIGEGFDLILCKNVLLHLSPEQRVDVLKMFHSALRPGGYLGVEQTQKIPVQVAEWFRPACGASPLYRRCELSDSRADHRLTQHGQAVFGQREQAARG